MTNEELTVKLTQAIRLSLAAIVGAHEEEHLNGYALCTDDDLRTLYPVGCTTEYCARSEEEDVRCIPVDWEYGEGSSSFDEANAEFVRRAESARNHAAHVDETFECLVTALQSVKNSGEIADDVLLIVTSTDPAPRLEQLAADAVHRLNTADLYEEWKSAM